jgi:hypothetical protein
MAVLLHLFLTSALAVSADSSTGRYTCGTLSTEEDVRQKAY